MILPVLNASNQVGNDQGKHTQSSFHANPGPRDERRGIGGRQTLKLGGIGFRNAAGRRFLGQTRIAPFP